MYFYQRAFWRHQYSFNLNDKIINQIQTRGQNAKRIRTSIIKPN